MAQQTGIRRELEADDKSVGASLRPAIDWRFINWRQVNRNVRCLQRRIVQAQQQGKKRKVRALQFILTRSFSGRCLAVRRVTEAIARADQTSRGHLLLYCVLHRGRLKGLSVLRGNSHGAFLGEAMANIIALPDHMVRKGQIEGVAKGDVGGQVRFMESLFNVAA